MTNRESLEAEVRRIVSPQAHPLIVECPDGTELKLHIRAISAEDLEDTTEIISSFIQGRAFAAVHADAMRKAKEGDGFDATIFFTPDIIKTLKDKLLGFLPWIIKAGTDITYDDIKKLDFLVTLEIVTEIIKFNYGERLMDFFSRGFATIGPLVVQMVGGLAGGLSPTASSSAGDTTSKTSGDGASEN